MTKKRYTQSLFLRIAQILLLVPFALQALEPIPEKKLNLKSLAKLAAQAGSRADHRLIAEQYEKYAEQQDAQVERHQRLEKLYSSTPASMQQKAASGWDSPRSHRLMAKKARERAVEARQLAQRHRELAESFV